MTDIRYQVFESSQVTDDMLQDAARLFNANYGVWGPQATTLNARLKEGEPVKMSVKMLRAKCLAPSHWTYVRATVDGILAGHAFVCRWEYPSGDDDDGNRSDKQQQQQHRICWITQLVVHREYRERGIATGMLRSVKKDDDEAYGIASSHPAACKAASRALSCESNPTDEAVTIVSVVYLASEHLSVNLCSDGIAQTDLEFIRDHAASILEASPVEYLKQANLHGSSFDNDSDSDSDSDRTISCVDTQFFVDHTEPLQALTFAEKEGWPLGKLLEGHEFLWVGRRKLTARERLHSLSVC
ncbi:MAG: hypothetical protein M1823_002982 [Watsoniomyces obsoletus]|nr:MAG: hypothetical protein M1823_002982 [Watsoniomyces obsoletus]